MAVPGLVYVEYRSRREGVDLELFHKFSRRHSAWSDAHQEDVLLLNIARTWRLSDTPSYIVAFHTPAHGLDRLTEWERVFTSGAADELIVTSRLANRIDVSGCYDALIAPTPAAGGRYYVEFFEFADGASRDEVTHFYAEDAARHEYAELRLLIDRIGHLGPSPRGMAAWEIPDYASLDRLARRLNARETPVCLARAGLYADVGDEIL